MEMPPSWFMSGQVANTVDFEGRGVVFVDYEDFEGEMKPSS